MRTFLLRIITENGKIYFQSVQLDITDNDRDSFNIDFDNTTILGLLTNKQDDIKKLERAVERTPLPEFNYSVQGHAFYYNTNWMHRGSPTSYTLPENITLALDLLLAYHTFLKTKISNFNIVSVQIIDFDPTSRFSNKNGLKVKKLLDLSQRKAETADAAMVLIIDKILSLKDIPPKYNQLLTVLYKLSNHVKASNESFGNVLKVLRRTSVLLDWNDAQLKSKLSDHNVTFLYKHIRSLIGNNLGGEATRWLDTMQIRAIRAAFAKSIQKGDKVVNKILFNEKFALREDGRIVVNFATSKFIRNENRKEEGLGVSYDMQILRERAEIIVLAAGYQFEKSNNVDQLVFTKESSKKLIDLNLHINSDYMKKLVRVKNEFHSFYKAKDRGLFSSVPADVIRYILHLAYGINLQHSEQLDYSKVIPTLPIRPIEQEENHEKRCVLM